MRFLWVLISLLSVLLVFNSADGDEMGEDYCIADEQTPDEELQRGMEWACGNGANCSAIEVDGSCYLPNTVLAHSSYAFNSYYQKMKHRGGSCYFRAAALISSIDPSHGSCKFEYQP